MTSLEIITLLSAIIGMVTGIGGLYLGIANHTQQKKLSAPNLRVLPKLAFPDPMDAMVCKTYFSERVAEAVKTLKTFVCIDITNIGATKQTVMEVGFINYEGEQVPWREPYCIEPVERFPLVLAPNERGAAYIIVCRSLENIKLYKEVYVKTDCGIIFKGTSPIMDDFLEHIGEGKPKQGIL
jgi:hypothetical protein